MCQIKVRLWGSKIWIVMSNLAPVYTFWGCACCCCCCCLSHCTVLCTMSALSLLACTAALVRMCSYQGIWSRRPSLHMHLVSKPPKATVLFLCRDGEEHHYHFCPRAVVRLREKHRTEFNKLVSPSAKLHVYMCDMFAKSSDCAHPWRNN